MEPGGPGKRTEEKKKIAARYRRRKEAKVLLRRAPATPARSYFASLATFCRASAALLC